MPTRTPRGPINDSPVGDHLLHPAAARPNAVVHAHRPVVVHVAEHAVRLDSAVQLGGGMSQGLAGTHSAVPLPGDVCVHGRCHPSLRRQRGRGLDAGRRRGAEHADGDREHTDCRSKHGVPHNDPPWSRVLDGSSDGRGPGPGGGWETGPGGGADPLWYPLATPIVGGVVQLGRTGDAGQETEPSGIPVSVSPGRLEAVLVPISRARPSALNHPSRPGSS
jgi:hypothetical protein